jgi:hypothetical protein
MRERIQTAAAYIILVATVVWLTWFIQHEFDQAHEQQCTLAWIQADITAADRIAPFVDADPEQPVPDQIIDYLTAVTRAIEDSCGDRIDVMAEYGPVTTEEP